jgi:hypothetical protein
MASIPVVDLIEWFAGATAAVNCGLCQAGTYATGAGLYVEDF